jgi:hypothetical protein
MFCRSANQTDSFLNNVSSPSAPRRLVGTGEDVPAVALAAVLVTANNSIRRAALPARCGSSLQPSTAGGSDAECPSALVLPALYPARISASSSLLAATMNQKSSLREDPQFVSWLLTGNTRFESALSRGLTPYVGRSCELETLKQSLAEAGTGLRVHDVVGEPGSQLGHSRLSQPVSTPICGQHKWVADNRDSG